MEKRRADRNLCADLVQIRWKDESGNSQQDVAILEDISSGGICLKSERPISPDAAVTVSYPNGTYQGRVRYCREHETGFDVGIQFEPGYRWSKPDHTPAHLLEFSSDPTD